MDAVEAVRVAERLLPGEGPIADESDPRWRALLALRGHVRTEPDLVWEFVRRWGSAPDMSLRHALAVCLLQELLALHFLSYFPRVAEQVHDEHLFADTFLRCGRHGQAALPAQSEVFDELARFAAKWCGAGSGSLPAGA
jgi:hypothetical protein